MSADTVPAPLVAALIRRHNAQHVPGRPSVGIWNAEIRPSDQIRVTTNGEIMSLLIVPASPTDDDADLIAVEEDQASRDLAAVCHPDNAEHRTSHPVIPTQAGDRQ